MRPPKDLVYSRLVELYKKYPPEDWRWIVSYSGGKDSSALLNCILEFSEKRNFSFEVLHHNTGVEYPIMEQHVNKVICKLRKRDIEVHITHPKKHFFEYMIENNYTFPRWNFRWCCRLLKWQPTTEFFEKQQGKILNLIAIRGDENTRPKLFIRPHGVKYMRKSLGNVVVASPLVDLTINDVWMLCGSVKRLYIEDQVRFGCWVCTVASSKTLAYFHPDLFKIKYELVEARCKGLLEFISILEKYKDALGINLNNSIKIKNIDRPNRCNKRCDICQINKWKKQSRELLNSISIPIIYSN